MSFQLDLQAFANKTNAIANAVVRKIVIDVGTALVMKSPVGDPEFWLYNRGTSENPDYVHYSAYKDTPDGYVGGRFRANWQYGLNAAKTDTTEDVDPQGRATIAAIVGKVDKEAAGEVHYITNSLPYADRLENGWSRQAPNGMVGLTVLEFEPIVEAAARALR